MHSSIRAVPISDPPPIARNKKTEKNIEKTHPEANLRTSTPVKRSTHVGIPLAMPQGHSKKITIL